MHSNTANRCITALHYCTPVANHLSLGISSQLRHRALLTSYYCRHRNAPLAFRCAALGNSVASRAIPASPSPAPSPRTLRSNILSTLLHCSPTCPHAVSQAFSDSDAGDHLPATLVSALSFQTVRANTLTVALRLVALLLLLLTSDEIWRDMQALKKQEQKSKSQHLQQQLQQHFTQQQQHDTHTADSDSDLLPTNDDHNSDDTLNTSSRSSSTLFHSRPSSTTSLSSHAPPAVSEADWWAVCGCNIENA